MGLTFESVVFWSGLWATGRLQRWASLPLPSVDALGLKEIDPWQWIQMINALNLGTNQFQSSEWPTGWGLFPRMRGLEVGGGGGSMIHFPSALFFGSFVCSGLVWLFCLFCFQWRSARAHQFLSSGQNQSTAAHRPGTTVAERSLTSCVYVCARFSDRFTRYAWTAQSAHLNLVGSRA